MIVGLEKLQNLYKGEVKLSVVKIDGNSTFKLTYEGLPKEAVLAIATAYWGDETTGMVQVIIKIVIKKKIKIISIDIIIQII